MHKVGLRAKQLGVSLCCGLGSGVKIKALATSDTYGIFCGISTIVNWDIDFLPECMKLKQKDALYCGQCFGDTSKSGQATALALGVWNASYAGVTNLKTVQFWRSVC